jgi:hypothetical protein
MKAAAAKRARVARVRAAQHLLAAAEAVTAEARLDQLEGNAAKLVMLRDSLTVAEGPTNGATLQNRGELAARLDRARHGMTDAIAGARATAVQRAQMRVEARQKQEGAAKLDARMAEALDAWLESKRAVPHRRRPAAGY